MTKSEMGNLDLLARTQLKPGVLVRGVSPVRVFVTDSGFRRDFVKHFLDEVLSARVL